MSSATQYPGCWGRRSLMLIQGKGKSALCSLLSSLVCFGFSHFFLCNICKNKNKNRKVALLLVAYIFLALRNAFLVHFKLKLWITPKKNPFPATECFITEQEQKEVTTLRLLFPDIARNGAWQQQEWEARIKDVLPVRQR